MNRYILVQIGARRNYAVPRIIEESGMLEAFYTDLCANVGLGATFTNYCPDFLKKGIIKNLLGRELPPNLVNKTYTFPIPVLQYLIRKQLASKSFEKSTIAFSQFQFELGKAMIKQGLGNATHLFTMFGEGTPFLQHAKEQGLTTVTEMFIIPNTHYIVKKEREKYPDLEQEPEENLVEETFNWFKEVCTLSDYVISPSLAVNQDLIENFNVSSQRSFVVPYGVDSYWFDVENHPIKGRIIFIGTADLRKGIHILGMASQKLKHRDYEFRIAGNVSDIIRQHSLTNNLNFLGRIPRVDIQKEYNQADILVLPTFAEGSAAVTYEALAVGIPVITTYSAGSVVRDGVDGYIIPEGDPVSLAQRIEELVENRDLRERMAQSAKERAQEYIFSKYKDRLLAVLNQI